MNLTEYRKRAVVRTLKYSLLGIAIFALPGLIAGLFRPRMFWWCILAIVPLGYSIQTLIAICTWELTMGTIEEVVVLNDHDQPSISANVTYMDRNNVARELTLPIDHYGDYEEGCESRLEELRQSYCQKYLGNSLPVFYKGKAPDDNLAYIEDVRIQGALA